MGTEKMPCGCLTRVYSDAGNRVHRPDCPTNAPPRKATMSDTTILYGASDDLIEVDGPFVREEFNPPYSSEETAMVLAFDRSDADGGSLLAQIRYASDGCWRINVLAGGEFTIRPARGESAGNDEDGVPGYSDRLEVHGRVGFVVAASGENCYVLAKAGV